MLVWNGATRFMWSSRSVRCSIRINGLEVAPWGEMVRAGVAGRCDCDRSVAFREAVTEVFANRTLDGLCAREVVGLPVFDCRWNFDGSTRRRRDKSVNYSGGDPRRIEIPLGDEPVRGQTAMQRAGCDTVQVRQIAAANSAKTIQIEMSVTQFQGIERPFNQPEIAAQGFIALEELERASDAAVAVVGMNAGHVRGQICRALSQRRTSHSQPPPPC